MVSSPRTPKNIWRQIGIIHDARAKKPPQPITAIIGKYIRMHIPTKNPPSHFYSRSCSYCASYCRARENGNQTGPRLWFDVSPECMEYLFGRTPIFCLALIFENREVRSTLLPTTCCFDHHSYLDLWSLHPKLRTAFLDGFELGTARSSHRAARSCLRDSRGSTGRVRAPRWYWASERCSSRRKDRRRDCNKRQYRDEGGLLPEIHHDS